ncbi:MAG: TorD/DmsD family molecular chaperone [Ilumatobacteraceae bacterium]|jgi:TorA maturation chaperone TorD
MTVDLAERAERRAAFAALAGALLLSEPGPQTAALVAQVPELQALGLAATSVEYERIFLRTVPPYESVFRSDSAERGGVVSSRVADHFDDIGFDEHRTARWRVAGPDHLGLELRAHSFLIGLEAAAWKGERPDEGTRHVEAQRRLFADHLGWWANHALNAIKSAGRGTAYEGLAHAISQFLADEADLLRPLPLLDTSQLPESPPIARMGPRRLARHLLAPARCGVWLGADDIAPAAQRLGFPWRPMDGRQNLVPLVAAAFDAGEIDELVGPWKTMSSTAAEHYGARAVEQPGLELVWRHFERLARDNADLLSSVGGRAMSSDDDEEIVVRISGAGARNALDSLRSQGFAAEVVDGE